MYITTLFTILFSLLILFSMLHSFILIKSWKTLDLKTRAIYIFIIVYALAYAIAAEYYVFIGHELFLQILFYGLIPLVILAIRYPEQLVTIQKNEITYAPFTSDERKEKMLQASFLQPTTVRAIGTFLALGFLATLLLLQIYLPQKYQIALNQFTADNPESTLEPYVLSPSKGLTTVVNEVAYMKNNELWTYNIETAQEKKYVDNVIPLSSGEFGTSDIHQSPNLRYVAYVTGDSDLFILDLTNNKNYQVTHLDAQDKYWTVAISISNWTPDSSILLYHLNNNNYCIDCSPSIYENTVTNPNALFGYHTYTIETQEDTYLANQTEYPRFIGMKHDSSGFYFEIHNQEDVDEPFIGTYIFEEQNYTNTGTKMFHFPGQIHASINQPVLTYTWTHERSNTIQPHISNLIIHNLHNNNITTLNSGDFASNYRGVFNPTDEYVIYKIKDTGKTFKYNTQTKTTEVLVEKEGQIQTWINNYEATFYETTQRGGGERILYLLDIRTGELTPIITEGFHLW